MLAKSSTELVRQKNSVLVLTALRRHGPLAHTELSDFTKLSSATISVITQDGRMVDKKVISSSTYAWNVKSLAAGTYYMRIEEDKRTTLLKFMKQ